jgi:hypothetical protein
MNKEMSDHPNHTENCNICAFSAAIYDLIGVYRTELPPNDVLLVLLKAAAMVAFYLAEYPSLGLKEKMLNGLGLEIEKAILLKKEFMKKLEEG